MANKTSIVRRGSSAARCLERAWAMLTAADARVPPAVMVVFAAGNRAWKLGHFAGSAWRGRGRDGGHEVAINPALFDTPAALLATLVHEAAHATLYEHDRSSKHVGGCGPDGRYHRVEFRNACRALGLECFFRNRRYGWSATEWPAEGPPSRYREIVDLLERSLPWGLESRGRVRRVERGQVPASGHLVFVCRCRPRRRI